MAVLPQDNLSYPVHIITGAGTKGSGFFLNTADASYLITARHVLFKDGLELRKGTAIITSLGEDLVSKSILNLDCEVLLASGSLKKHDRADVAVCKIATAKVKGKGLVQTVPGVEIKQAVSTGVRGLSQQATTLLADVIISSEVFVFSYPISLGRDTQLDRTRPLLRHGIVAGKTEDGRIILDCPVYFGNSGGLVIQVATEGNLNTFKGIGIAVEMVPFVEELWSKQFNTQTGVRYENSGYSIVEPMDRIIELI